MLFTGIVFCLSQGYALYQSYSTEKNNLIERASVLATGIGHGLKSVILASDKSSASEILSAFSADQDIVRVKLYTTDRQLFAMYEQKGQLAPVPTEQQRLSIQNHQFAISDEYIFLLVPVVDNEQVIANLRMTISKQSFEELYHHAFASSLNYLLILVISTLVLYLMVEKYILKPVYSLSSAMHAFIVDSRHPVNIKHNANDEIGALVTAFNTMLERLDSRQHQLEVTLDTVEHEKAFANEVVETVKDSLVVIDNNGYVIHFNRATCDIFRRTPAYLKGIKLIDLLGDASCQFVQAAIAQQVEFTDKQVWIVDVFNRHKLLNLTSTQLSKHGQVLFAIQDITEVEAAQRRQRLAAGVFENSQDGLIVTNQFNVITMVNPAVSHLLGHTQQSLLGMKPEEIFDWQQFRSLMPTIKQAVNEYGLWQGEVWEQHKLGHKKVPLFVKVTQIASSEFEDAYDFVYLLSDLSSDKEMERLEYLAHHDSLTGLANRAELYRVMETIVKAEPNIDRNIALLYIDLDGFKNVNDTYGHDAGDEVLKQVAMRLAQKANGRDLVARLSGDEFVVLLVDLTKQAATEFANEIVPMLKRPIEYQNQQLKVGASVGVHYTKTNQGDTEAMLKAADSAMYQAKTSGKGRFVVQT